MSTTRSTTIFTTHDFNDDLEDETRIRDSFQLASRNVCDWDIHPHPFVAVSISMGTVGTVIK